MARKCLVLEKPLLVVSDEQGVMAKKFSSIEKDDVGNDC